MSSGISGLLVLLPLLALELARDRWVVGVDEDDGEGRDDDKDAVLMLVAEAVVGVGGIDNAESSVGYSDSEPGGTVGNLTPSSSPSRMISPSSAHGKKLRKRASACHLDACLNSIQTSIRPGRESAGSRRSRWFVVLRDGQK